MKHIVGLVCLSSYYPPKATMKAGDASGSPSSLPVVLGPQHMASSAFVLAAGLLAAALAFIAEKGRSRARQQKPQEEPEIKEAELFNTL